MSVGSVVTYGLHRLSRVLQTLPAPSEDLQGILMLDEIYKLWVSSRGLLLVLAS